MRTFWKCCGTVGRVMDRFNLLSSNNLPKLKLPLIWVYGKLTHVKWENVRIKNSKAMSMCSIQNVVINK